MHTLNNVESVLKEAYAAGVGKIVAVSMDLASYEKTLAIRSNQVQIIPSLGLHPWNAYTQSNELEDIVARIKDVSCVGEIGLDYLTFKNPEEHRAQLRAFNAQLAPCEGTSKAVNIHSVGAEREVIEILTSYNLKRVNMHWYDPSELGEPLALVPRIVDLGWFVSITPNIATSKNVQELARMVPIENLITETDTHSNVKYNGVQSSPKMIALSIEGISKIKRITPSEVEAVVAHNFERLVG